MSIETVVKSSTKNPKKRKLVEGPADIDHEPKSPKRATHDSDVSGRDPALLSDTFARIVAETRDKNLTTIELSEFAIPSRAFEDTSGFVGPRTAADLPAFLERYSPGGKQELSKCKDKASPHTMVLAMSGMRVADIYRELVVYNNPKSKVGKFIAKHMKLKDNVKYLERQQGRSCRLHATTLQRPRRARRLEVGRPEEDRALMRRIRTKRNVQY